MYPNSEWLRQHANLRIQSDLQKAEAYRLEKLVTPKSEHLLLNVIKRGVFYPLSIVGRALRSAYKEIIVHLILRRKRLVD